VRQEPCLDIRCAALHAPIARRRRCGRRPRWCFRAPLRVTPGPRRVIYHGQRLPSDSHWLASCTPAGLLPIENGWHPDCPPR
jgi:hypothetical protein